MTERKRRARPAEPMDERKELVQRFIAVVREDPWFNVLPHEVVGFNVHEYYNKLCWLIVGEYVPLIELRDERWVCSGAGKLGFGDEPREALLRWYISMRAGLPTVTEIREQEEKEHAEAEQSTRKRRSRNQAGDVAERVEVTLRQYRRSRSA